MTEKHEAKPQTISQTQEVKDHFHKSEEIFRLMVESIKDYAIFMLDTKGNVATWNEGAKKFKGYKASEIIGQHFSKFYAPDEIRAKKPEMELKIAESVGRFEDEGWRLRKDGSRFWANVIITALRDKTNKLVGFSKVTRDLTERKKAEEDLKSAYEGLEVKIKEKTSQLEDALRTRDEFLSIASHELKTPITSIKMQLQMAKHRLNSPKGNVVDLEKFNKTLDVTVGQVDRLTQLIDDLLNISRIQAGKLSYLFEKTNFSKMLTEVLEGFSQELSSSHCEVMSYVDEELEGTWDRARLEQVLVNLISNAIKYAGGSQIVVFAKREDNKAVFSVQDFGPGIPKDVRNRIFERFERVGFALGFKSQDILKHQKDMLGLELAKVHQKYTNLEQDTFFMIADWYHLTILEVMKLNNFEPDVRWIAKRLDVNVNQIKMAVDRLQRLGILEINADGEWIDKTEGFTTHYQKEKTSEARKSYQLQLLEKSKESLMRDDYSIRDHSSMTMAIDPMDMMRAKEELEAFRKKLSSLLETTKNRKEIYQLQIGFYPLTRKKG